MLFNPLSLSRRKKKIIQTALRWAKIKLDPVLELENTGHAQWHYRWTGNESRDQKKGLHVQRIMLEISVVHMFLYVFDSPRSRATKGLYGAAKGGVPKLQLVNKGLLSPRPALEDGAESSQYASLSRKNELEGSLWVGDSMSDWNDVEKVQHLNGFCLPYTRQLRKPWSGFIQAWKSKTIIMILWKGMLHILRPTGRKDGTVH